MPFKQLETHPNFPKLEEQVLKFWEKNKIFEKSLKQNTGKQTFVFFEGPPTANGRPGVHHAESRSFKDAVLRYQAMRGRDVTRKAGWDTHGLPVEIEVEKSLGISGKREIENIVHGNKKSSIEKFNRLCQQSVWKYKDEWEKFTARMGFWIDLESPYVTYENNYIESVWAVLKRISERNVKGEPLLFKSHKVVPYCPRCGTAVSSHEVAQGYEKVSENSVYVKFRVISKSVEVRNKKSPEVLEFNKPTYLVSWTTTPWTLPGNVALAVNPEIEYSVVSQGGQNFIVATDLLDQVLEGKFTLLEKIVGSDLVGLQYEPLFSIKELESDKSYKVYPADFVNTQDGTGIVHTAVMYGEDDYELGTKIGLPKFHTVDDEGKFISSLPSGLRKQEVKSGKTEKQIMEYLSKSGALLKEMQYSHDYPFCWRCKTALLYYARDSWFIRMSALRDELLKNNQQINWVPDYIKDGRFGGWLTEAKDWAISRDRYWGTPLPIWVCEKCDQYKVIGSVDELGKKEIKDLHRPFIDEVMLSCECGGKMHRTTEVLDVWFDSGAMPYAQWHYPFENEDIFKKQFPADFITEAIDQTRGWFYTLLAISTAIGNTLPPYKNVINLGHILDEKGRKMSKSKGNVIEPFSLMDQFGIDVVRWYMYSVNQPGDNKNFKQDDLLLMQRRVQLISWNILNYLVTYANNAGWEPSKNRTFNSDNILDQWIYLRLQELTVAITDNMDQYNLFRSVRSIDDFINELSTWYLRRSRGRNDVEFFSTLHLVLIELAKLLAPFMPFYAETIFNALGGESDPESVHLADWPEKRVLSDSDKKVLKNMSEVRSIVEAVLSWRKAEKIKVRQPLSDLLIKTDNAELQNYSHLLADELNFVNIQVVQNFEGQVDKFDKIEAVAGKHPEIYLNKELSEELRLQGMARELERSVQDLRKKSGLVVGQGVDLYYETDSRQVYDSFEYFDQNKTYVSRVIGARQKTDFETELQIGGHKIWLGLKKVRS